MNIIQIEARILDGMQPSTDRASGAVTRQMLDMLPAADLMAMLSYSLHAVQQSDEMGNDDKDAFSLFVYLHIEMLRTIANTQRKRMDCSPAKPYGHRLVNCWARSIKRYYSISQTMWKR